MKRIFFFLSLFLFTSFVFAQNACIAKIEIGKDSLKSGWNLYGFSVNGTPPFTYLWNTGSTESKLYIEKEGTYCVTITDANKCVSMNCFTHVVSPSGCAVEITKTASNELIANAKGAAPFKYLWSGPNNFSATTQGFKPTVSGTYTVTVTDANGCVSKSSFTIVLNGDCKVTLTQSKLATGGITIFANPTPAPSNTLAVKYLWSNGATSQSISVKESGKYCVTTTNSNGCTATACTEVTLDSVKGKCAASISVKVVGIGVWKLKAIGTGKAPFKYQWSEGSTSQSIFVALHNVYCVTITDATGCVSTACVKIGNVTTTDCGVVILQKSTNELLALAKGNAPYTYRWEGPNGFTSSDMIIKYTIAGTYCVVVVDSTGCKATACITIKPTNGCGVDIIQYRDSTQKFAKLLAKPSGTAPFTYLWSNGATTETIVVEKTGEYCVTVKDATGCVAKSCIKVEFACSVNINIIAANNGTTAKKLVAIATGKAPFKFKWSTGATTESILVEKAGEYCVTVTDTTGCVAKSCVNVSFDGCGVTIKINPLNVGKRLVAVPTGKAPFTFLWSNGQKTDGITVEKAGEYCVTVTDSTGCVAKSCINVTFENCTAKIDIVTSPNSSVRTLVATGTGVAPFVYLWSTGQTTQSIEVKDSKEYCVTIKDATGCVAKACIALQGACSTTILLDSLSNGAFILEAIPTGVGPFKYLWSNGSTDKFVKTDSKSKEFCVTVTDVTGCISKACLVTPKFGGIGVEEKTNINPTIEFYPNPVYDNLKIKITEPKESNITIYDLNGKVIYTKAIDPLNDGFELNINTQNWLSGIYFVKTNGSTHKIIKM